MRSPVLRVFLALVMCVLFTHPLSARQDTDHGPIVAVAPETHGAVSLGGLPTVPELVMAQGLGSEGQADVEAWLNSWSLSLVDGAKVRRAVYPSVSARLYPLLNHQGVTELLNKNQASLRTARSLWVILANRQIESALEDAHRLHDLALSSLLEGEGERALGLALQSADALRAVSPEQVASGLLREAQESLRRNGASGSYSEEQLTRIRRLTDGARDALEGEDYPRAIRRAYYACQLLGVELR